MKRFVLLIAATALCAQQPPAFEAASVKLTVKPGPGYGTQVRGGQFEMTNFPLRRLIQFAYGVKDYAYSGPGWLESVSFDVMAKLPADAARPQIPEMLQTLLAERFNLAVHREAKEIAGLVLVVDKKGLRIQPVEPPEHPGSGWGSNMVQGTGVTMAAIADLLANAINRPVKDQTGAAGSYTIKLRWLPDGPAPANSDDLAPSVYAAVQELGLRLDVQKMPIDTLIVDHAERAPIEK